MSDARRVRLPHYQVRHDFLAADAVAWMLDHVMANEEKLLPTRVGSSDELARRPEFRSSRHFGENGPNLTTLKDAVRAISAELTKTLRMKPFEVARVETDLVVHGDGGFYVRHIDTMRPGTGDPQDRLRLITGVYYFHAQPKAFEGGALRLHELGGPPDGAAHIDIEPVHNSIVFFPAWMPHEVMPVRVSSRRFVDSRFSINCWLYGQVG